MEMLPHSLLHSPGRLRIACGQTHHSDPKPSPRVEKQSTDITNTDTVLGCFKTWVKD